MKSTFAPRAVKAKDTGMKIGILTFHVAHNYGAVLQTYALQKYLSKKGHEVEVIDYRPKSLLNPYQPWLSVSLKGLSLIRKIKRIAGLAVLASLKCLRRKGFNRFIENRMVLSNKVGKSTFPNAYDAYILGSDQIWNPQITKKDFTYTGVFARKPGALRIAYAASAGLGEDLICSSEEAMNAIKEFDAVSVRESTLKNKLKEKIHKEITVALDPTLLVDENVFTKLAVKPRTKSKYVLVYKMLPSEALNEIAQRIAKNNSITLTEISPTVSLWELFNSAHYKMFEAPEEFLGWFQNAACVVTTSFHGVTFAIIFRISFYFVSSGNPAENRITSLLEQLGLSNRIISGGRLPDFTAINYSASLNGAASVEERLAILRQESRDFLDNALSCKNTSR